MDELIDFPCSDSWVDWYHHLGLTGARSGRTYPPRAKPRAPTEEEWQKVDRHLRTYLPSDYPGVPDDPQP